MTNQTKKILFISLSIALVGSVTTLAIIKYTPPTQQAAEVVTDNENTDQSEVVSDIETTADTIATTEPETTVSTAICSTNEATGSTFNLISDASVYNTAANAKAKTNQTGTYHAGEYSIYKCYDGMANITKTSGSPGGWIDPQDPYSSSSSSTPTVVVAPSIDVMSLNNTVVNWSHEYPSTFVSNYNGYWNIPGNNLYLTFDCGYDYNNLASTIMDILAAKNIKAVFFVTGDFMNDRPDLVLRMLAEGHIVGNHSYAHLNQPQNLGTSTDVIVNDLQAWENKYISIVGGAPTVKYFRPPAGAISERSMGLISGLGYKTLMWGAAYNDWDTSTQPSQETAMTLLRKYTTAGDIVLLHGISETSTSILSQYVDEYKDKGFTFKLF